MKMIKTALGALALSTLVATSPVLAAGGDVHTEDVDFSFEGPLGVYDRAELQRGLQVYLEVCAACHGMKFVAFRTLADEHGPGLTMDQVKAIIDQQGYEVQDEEGEPGDTRPAQTYDYFPDIKSAGAPDMSLLAKARAGGPEHIYSVLVGYSGEVKEVAGTVLYENNAFPGGYINMGPPLEDDLLEYADGTPATLETMSKDVSAFLMWAAEPKMVERKQAGVRNILFLIIFAVMLYFVNRRLWRKIKHPE